MGSGEGTGPTIAETIPRGIKVLFDLPEVMLFLLDEQHKILRHHGNAEKESFHLPLNASSGVTLKCLQEEGIRSSFDGEVGETVIPDEQLARRMGKTGLF